MTAECRRPDCTAANHCDRHTPAVHHPVDSMARYCEVKAMFAGIITRDNGEPWGDTGMTSAKWLTVPTRIVTIGELIATQPGVLLHALRDDAPQPVGGDTYPHVIAWRGQQYLEDGHHRVVRARLNGHHIIEARVLEVD